MGKVKGKNMYYTIVVLVILLISGCASRTVKPDKVLVPQVSVKEPIVVGDEIVKTYKKQIVAEAGPLILDDFDDETSENNMNGRSGVLIQNPNDKTQMCYTGFDSFYRVGDTGRSLKLTYDVDSPNDCYVGYWTRLPWIDLTLHDRFTIYIKGSKEKEGFTRQLRLELKSLTETGQFLVTGITDEWKRYTIPINAFKDSYGKSMTTLNEITEFIVMFERGWMTDKEGVIYIDNLYFSIDAPDVNVRTVKYGKRIKGLPEGPLWVDSFDDQAKPNDVGGDYGVWQLRPDDYTQNCRYDFNPSANHGGKGAALQLSYDVDSPNEAACNGFWVKLNGQDLTYYDDIVFFIKGTRSEKGFMDGFRVELKNSKGETGAYFVKGITKWWQKFEIPLKSFSGLSTLKDMTEFVIVFEDRQATDKEGVLYIDDIMFTARTYRQTQHSKRFHKGLSRLSREDRKEFEKYYSRGLHFYHQFEPEQALVELNKAKRIFPKHYSTRMLIKEVEQLMTAERHVKSK